MPLEQEIQISSKEISTDGYEMSIGELISLYRDEELVINPVFQRLFRWDESRKTKFIESILLGIPIPPIFVFQTEEGNWELVDGLQRLSTLLEFVGVLRGSDGAISPPSILSGTRLLPSLADKSWEVRPELPDSGIGRPQQLEIRRARMRVEILKKESDPQSKYELFQRLNTGGQILTPQEVRNCTLVMVNEDFYKWVVEMSDYANFKSLVIQTSDAEQKQRIVELALRFIVYRNVPYRQRLDVHEYLDNASMSLASNKDFDLAGETIVFHKSFDLMSASMGADIFKRYDNGRFLGGFSLSAYEAIATGIAHNLNAIEALGEDTALEFIRTKVRSLWSQETFTRYSGAGIRGTTRLVNLLPFSREYFRP